MTDSEFHSIEENLKSLIMKYHAACEEVGLDFEEQINEHVEKELET